MPITVDHSRPFRSHARRVELVEAVLAADAEDEGDWIEWKGDVDLKAAAGQFKLARALLSMANRSVASAHRYAGGTGYIVFGASHRNQLPGTARIDGAELAQRMESWLGSPAAMVEWDVNYVQRDGKSVLVVTVEPPAPGQHIATLHRQHETPGKGTIRKGTVFVRKGTRSEQADPADLRMLEERLLGGQATGPAELNLDIIQEVEAQFIRYDFSSESPTTWLARRRRTIDPPPLPAKYGSMAIFDLPAMNHMRESVEDHLERCRDVLPRACAGYLARMKRNRLELVVTNPDDESVRDAQLVLELPDEWMAFTSVARAEMPGPERGYRSTFGPAMTLPALRPRDVSPGDATVSEDQRTVTFHIGDVRARQSVPCQPVTLVTHGFHPDQPQSARWSATSIARRGVVEGSLPFDLGSETMTLRDLIGDP